MKCHHTAAVLVLLSGSVLAQAAAPSKAGPLSLTLSQALVKSVTENGKSSEKLLPAPKAVLPGAVLEQAITATNTVEKDLGNVVVNLPVPNGMTYLSAFAPAAATQTLFSFDGGLTFGAAPLMKTIAVTENGQLVQKRVEVKPSEYTNVRWVLPTLAAGEALKLGFRVRVN